MRILCLGDNVVDRFLDRKVMYPGGQAMNVAVYSQMLGMDSAYMGFFGTDDKADVVKAILKNSKIDFSRCKTIEGENAYALVITENGERVFLWSNKGGVARQREWDFNSEDMEYIRTFDLVFTDQNSYMEGNLSLLANAGCRIAFDFSKKFDSDYVKSVAPNCCIAFISTGEMKEAEVVLKMKELASYGVKLVVATRGELGSIALFDGELFSQGIVKVEVCDTMGAGDSFETALIEYLFRFKEITKTSLTAGLKVAAEFASKICQTEGSYGHGVSFELTDDELSRLKSFGK